MYSDKEILARLQRGEKAEDIAKEMTAQLNAAIDQKKKADEEYTKRLTSERHLQTAATEINAYLKEQFPDAVKKGVSITASDVKEMVAAVVEVDNTIGSLSDLMDKIFKDVDKTTSADPLAKFLKEHGLR